MDKLNRSTTAAGRYLAVCAVFVGCCLLASQAIAAPLTSQDGLPPALTIQTQQNPDGSISESDLREQILQFDKMAEWARERQPKLGFLERLFGSSSTPRAVPIADLRRSAQSLKGLLVAVEGMYGKSEAADAVLEGETDKCLVTLAEGTKPEGFEGDSAVGFPATVTGTVEMRGDTALIRATLITPSIGLSMLRKARALELLGDSEAAIEAYTKAEGSFRGLHSDLAAFCRTSAGRIAYDELRDKKLAGKHLNMAWTTYLTNARKGAPAYYTWVPDAAAKKWKRITVHDAIATTLNDLNAESFWYDFVGFFVAICGGNSAFGVLLLAVAVRLLIWPLTKKQLQSAEAMKRLQPQMKALQAKHADDKERFQQEFWKLCQANGVNPLGGCLPLIVQMPVLIMVYQGIRLYVVEFDKASFLWVENLAGPDMILLVAYTISMILFQKMTQATNPQTAMDPQQEQQQKMMMYMMPLMFFFMFKTFPAAFILYWLGTNIIYFLQQWNYMRRGSDAKGATPSGKSGGFVDAMARMLSGEPHSAQQDEEGPSGEEKDVDRRSMTQIEKESKETTKPKKRRRHL